MVHVNVKILGALNKPLGKDEFSLELPEGCCLEDVMLKAGYHQNHLRFILPAVNGVQQPLGVAIKEGDQVLLALPTSGG